MMKKEERIKLGIKQQKTFMRKILKGNIPERAIIQSCIDTCDDILEDVEELTKPSWIPITPKTTLEVNVPVYTDHSGMKGICHIDESGMWWESGNRVTQPNHYMPIPETGEENR